MIIEKSGVKYHHTLTYTIYFVNGDSDKRYQERYMLILHLKKRKMLSKKGCPDTCG
jgi:hypothetical protein